MRDPETIAGEIAALHEEQKRSDDAYRARVDALREEHAAACRATHEATTCPRRREMGPWTLDWWRPEPNGERSCSFCGSAHPDDFDRHLDRVLADPDARVTVDLADGRHKVYLHRPEARVAGEGPIKFYVAHAPAAWGEPDSGALNKLNAALRRSREKFAARQDGA